ncbi:MAG: glycosyltransferase family 4 protein [Armatimonadetes bacterium]|nr:glycosyltransferase family 4 protein [Armatimonadota bacterium]
MHEPLSGLRVAFVATQAFPRKAGDVVAGYCRALCELGADVELVLIARGDLSAPGLLPRPIPIHCLGMRKQSWRKRTSRALGAALNNIRPQIVHAWGYDASIHASRAVAEAVGIRLIIAQVDSDRRIARRVRGWMLRRVPSLVTSPSLSACKALRAWYGYAQDICAVLPDPFSPEFFNPPKRDDELANELGLDDAYPVVIWPAKLNRRKGQVDLIRAWREVVREFPAGRLLIVGDGKFRDKLPRLAQRLGVRDSVAFTGFRPDVLRLLSVSHILACPSRSETLCLSVLEAMAAGVPVVSTRVWGPVDYIEDGVNGLLVPVGAWRELARGIKRLASDRELARRLSEAARAMVRQKYSFETFRARLAELYCRVLGGR